ncbi:MAG: O-antigen ligase family protein [Nibricoccus sp.]
MAAEFPSSQILMSLPEVPKLSGTLSKTSAAIGDDRLTKPLRTALLLALAASIYNYDIFRVPGVEKNDGLFGLALSAFRGALQYYGQFAPFVLSPVYLALRSAKSFRFRWRTLWPFVTLIIFLGVAALCSSASAAVEYRWSWFFSRVLPALLCAVVCVDRCGIRLVKAWVVGGATFTILFLLMSGRLLPVLNGNVDTAMEVGSVVGENLHHDRFVVLSDPITTSLIFYLAGLAGLSHVVDLKGYLLKFGVLVQCMISIGVAAITGARGPMIAFIVALVVMVAVSRIGLRRKIMLSAIGVLALTCFLVVLPDISPTSAKRIYGLIGRVVPSWDIYGANDDLLDAGSRVDHYGIAMAAPVTLFGRGVGSFGDNFGEPEQYAHNVFLEAHYETGILGLVIVSFTFLSCLARLAWYAAKRGGEAGFCLGALTFYFVECQFSGTLIMEVGLLLFLMVGYMCIAVEQRGTTSEADALRGRRLRIRRSSTVPGLVGPRGGGH